MLFEKKRFLKQILNFPVFLFDNSGQSPLSLRSRTYGHYIYSLLLRAKYLLIAMKGNELIVLYLQHLLNTASPRDMRILFRWIHFTRASKNLNKDLLVSEFQNPCNVNFGVFILLIVFMQKFVLHELPWTQNSYKTRTACITDCRVAKRGHGIQFLGLLLNFLTVQQIKHEMMKFLMMTDEWPFSDNIAMVFKVHGA